MVTIRAPNEELLLDAYTGGKVSDTGTITANNVDMVKDLLDPIQYLQVKELGGCLMLCRRQPIFIGSTRMIIWKRHFAIAGRRL